MQLGLEIIIETVIVLTLFAYFSVLREPYTRRKAGNSVQEQLRQYQDSGVTKNSW